MCLASSPSPEGHEGSSRTSPELRPRAPERARSSPLRLLTFPPLLRERFGASTSPSFVRHPRKGHVYIRSWPDTRPRLFNQGDVPGLHLVCLPRRVDTWVGYTTRPTSAIHLSSCQRRARLLVPCGCAPSRKNEPSPSVRFRSSSPKGPFASTHRADRALPKDSFPFVGRSRRSRPVQVSPRHPASRRKPSPETSVDMPGARQCTTPMSFRSPTSDPPSPKSRGPVTERGRAPGGTLPGRSSTALPHHRW